MKRTTPTSRFAALRSKKPSDILPFLRRHKWHAAALTLIVIWSLPMLLSRNRIEFGDFSYFSQLHQAIKLSILDYHQFPWWNPWVAGGVPLYANPQAGVFSITTLLSFFVMPSFAIKLTIFLFYILGYLSMVRLLAYLKVRGAIAAMLGAIWVLNGYFVAHLPAHFTFMWLLVLPWFIYKALTVNSRKSGFVLGLALGVVALAQIHYSFIQICLVVALILIARFIFGKQSRREVVIASLVALGTFLVLSLHRIIFTLEAAKNLPKEVFDPTSSIKESILSFVVPHSYNFGWIKPATQPFFGWQEQTAYPSIFFVGAVLLSLLFVGWLLWSGKVSIADFRSRGRTLTVAVIVGVATFFSFLVGMGDRFPLAPYGIMKELPFFGDMRISARWFIFTVLGLLLLVGVLYVHRLAKGHQRFLVAALCGLAILELFFLNFTYQAKVLNHSIAKPPKDTPTLTFGQHIRFGESPTSPDGIPIPYADRQYLYREYESTLFNMGTILANEAHVNIYENDTPRCSYVAGCGLVLSKNAEVASWTPNKIVLKRMASGDIELNMNDSNYISVNGVRRNTPMVSNRQYRFFLGSPDSEQTITLEFVPNLSVQRVKNALKQDD